MADELVAMGVVAQQVEGLLEEQEHGVVEILAQSRGQGVKIVQEIHKMRKVEWLVNGCTWDRRKDATGCARPRN